MVNMEMQELFFLAQNGQLTHKKYLKVLHNIYKTQELEEFLREYMRLLLHALIAEPKHKYAESMLLFAASFCVEIVTDYEKCLGENDEWEPHPLFLGLVNKVLKYVTHKDSNIRYHVCQFLSMILSNFGTNIAINDIICDKIQKALLKTSMDMKPVVRMQAIKVLLRLQNPSDVNCPIIESFISSLSDTATSVRKLVVESIAPCQTSFSHIINRLRDVEPSVRTAAFTKLSKIPPRALTINYRQTVIISGILESYSTTKQTFEQVLLPKWLKAYDSDVICFMVALKLDANEEDVNQTEQIYGKLLPIIFKQTLLPELLALLGFDDANKLIPIGDLTLEKVTFWSYFIGYLKSDNQVETEFEFIIPMLTDFVAYIDSYVKFKSQNPMKNWEYLDYQQILQKLFELLLKLDKSDEFGREALEKLLVFVLINEKLESRVIGVIIKVFHTIVPSVEKLAYELCTIIADIKEPLVPIQRPSDVLREQEIRIAQIKVKLHILTDELKQAIEEKKFDVVDKLSKEAENLEKQVKDEEKKLHELQQPFTIRRSLNDTETICRCMDIILALMENIYIKKLPVPLLTFKDEFFKNVEFDPRYVGAYSKIFKMTCFYSILDKDTAISSLETICTPIMSYRASPVFEKIVLKVAVAAVSDLMRVYGPDIFNTISDKQANGNNTTVIRKRANDRTLYREEGCDSDSDTTSVTASGISSNVIINIILSMLDDNHSEIRAHATVTITNLMVRGLCVSSSLVTRLLLKWFNPMLNPDDKNDQKVQSYIGTALSKYLHDVEGSDDIFEKAVISTLSYIGNAPKTSPFSDINCDDVLQCLIKFTRMTNKLTMDVHKNLAYLILNQVMKFQEPSVRILTKMLTHLDIPAEEPLAIKELSQQIENAQEIIYDKLALLYLKKYLNKLNGIANNSTTTGTTLNGTNGTTRTSSINSAKGHKQKQSSNKTLQTTADIDGLASIQEENGSTINENSRTLTTPSSVVRTRRSSKNSDLTINENSHTLVTPSSVVRTRRSSKNTDLTINENSHTVVTPSIEARTRRSSRNDEIDRSTCTSASTSAKRRNRKLSNNNVPGELGAIEENDNAYNIETSPSPADSLESNDGVFTRDEVRKECEKKITMSVKRKKVRGKQNSSQTERRSSGTAKDETEENIAGASTRNKLNSKASSIPQESVLFTSSDSEEIPNAAAKRKSQRK